MSASHSWEDAVAWLITQPQYHELVVGSYFDPPLAEAAIRYWRSAEWSTVRQLAPSPPGDALDLGAGNGIATFALAKDGWRVTAIEPDPSETVGAGAVRKLMASAALPVTLLQEYGEALPIQSESMDFVLARQVMHHARDLRQLCRELARVLRPGGTLITLRDHTIFRDRDLKEFLARHPLHALYGGEAAYRVKIYREALENAGLTIRREIGPFDSVVNYAPYTRDDLRRLVATRGAPDLLAPLLHFALRNDAILNLVLAILSRFDRTPGRLYSFVCSKPA